MAYSFDTEIALDSLLKIKAMLELVAFEIDTDVVFRTIEEDIPQMKPVVEKIINDLSEE
ncbi:hypothetical protein M1D30_00475 [Prevotella sp. E15-22]|jgi:uncharacterized protein with HEPN domain|uniref:hypothetical protein n=1 Tax=Prevotella sp. E15-22 TaxID=2937774 RepID=UPI00204C63C0|nr:hypothetical protein [Prevotella sp. E15-22]UPS44678.1 hypothetical protein M1D30_00475 [Prevotella sp. E15-22]